MQTEAQTYGPRPDNAGRAGAEDWRFLLGVPSGLLLQVCHPVIGGGVGAHSTYRSDPFGRARRSIWPVISMVVLEDPAYGADLRAMHRGIGGEDHLGRRYHAWNAEAAFWVCATAAHAAETVARLFGTPLTEQQKRENFHAWRRAGLTFGIPEDKIPTTYAEFTTWFHSVLTGSLEDHPTAQDVLDSVRHPPAPPHVPRLAWIPVQRVLGPIATLITIGSLPSEARGLLGVAWTDRDERRLALVARVIRLVNRLIPRRLRALNGLLVRRYEQQIRGHAAHGAELGIAPSLAQLTTPDEDAARRA